MVKLTEKEKKEKVQNLRPIDDVFFEVLAQNKGVCEEMLPLQTKQFHDII